MLCLKIATPQDDVCMAKIKDSLKKATGSDRFFTNTVGPVNPCPVLAIFNLPLCKNTGDL